MTETDNYVCVAPGKTHDTSNTHATIDVFVDHV